MAKINLCLQPSSTLIIQPSGKIRKESFQNFVSFLEVFKKEALGKIYYSLSQGTSGGSDFLCATVHLFITSLLQGLESGLSRLRLPF